MKNPIARRTILMGLGQAVTLGGLGAALPRAVSAAQAAAAAPSKVCLSVIYPAGEGLKFDADAFRDRHVPLLKKSFGKSVQRVELRVPLPPPPPPPAIEGEPPPPVPTPPPFLAIVTMWLGDLAAYIELGQSSAKARNADMATITNSAPMVQYDMLAGEVGEAASTIIGGSTVVAQYFFAKEGGTWDAAYFGETYLPKLVALYGPTAIQRAEVSKGELAQGGGKPLVVGSLHLYLKDQAAYDAAAAGAGEAGVALGTEAQQHSSINPVTLLMTVHSTG
jgi:hypothetical protein